jgi:prepilin-type N-terminal cleavage/methylation domain-containing protein
MPSRALNGRDPQLGKNGFSTTSGFTSGFTLIELMVVIAVVAIITSFALPSYRTIIEKRQVTSGAEQLGAFLSAVQIEAVKRSENITVSYDFTDSTDWCVGIASGTAACDCSDTTVDGDCRIDGQLRIFHPENLNYPGALSGVAGDGAFVFDPARGLVYDDSSLAGYDSAEMQFLSDDETYALNVQVSATGRVKYCSDSADKKVPGYDVCAP